MHTGISVDLGKLYQRDLNFLLLKGNTTKYSVSQSLLVCFLRPKLLSIRRPGPLPVPVT
jgi:hypothetical protein